MVEKLELTLTTIGKAKKAGMPKFLTVQPTKTEIKDGATTHPTKCMYALAIRRLFPQATFVSVNPNGITVTYKGRYYHYHIPTLAAHALMDFDAKALGNVDPRDLKMTPTLVSTRPVRDVPEREKELHRLNSRKRRSDPNYERPDKKRKATLRARIMKYHVRQKAAKVRSDEVAGK